MPSARSELRPPETFDCFLQKRRISFSDVHYAKLGNGVKPKLTEAACSTFSRLRDIFPRISAHPMNRLEDPLPNIWQTPQTTTQNLPA